VNYIGDAVLPLLNEIRQKLAIMPQVWQHGLLTAAQLGRFASERGIRISNEETIRGLWQVGLLRADLVSSDGELSVPGLVAVAKVQDNTYCDQRRVPHRPNGFGGALAESGGVLANAYPQFHPFRLYVLYHVERIFGSDTSCTQYLVWPEGLKSLAGRAIEDLNRWTAQSDSSDRFDYWNRVCELAIGFEPLAYQQIHREVRIRFPVTEESLSVHLAELRAKASPLIREMTTSEIRRVREDLGQTAQQIDANRELHVLLRLMSAHERRKLRSRIGSCMLLLEMAEVIRRPVEAELELTLPEEDQIGFGQWIEGARKEIYGTERVFDASTTILRDYLSSLGLDYGVKIRCYVEGDTEYGALSSAVGVAAGIELVNLRGQVVERRGKGLAFSDALRRNSVSHIFSAVVIDADREDYVRALRRVAESGEAFCPFFLLDPDFEFGNFTARELLAVALKLGRIDQRVLDMTSGLEAQILATCSNKDFLRVIASVETARAAKDELWGAALMTHALEHPELPAEHGLAGQTRPIVEAARLLNRARSAGYLRSLVGAAVDPVTGRIVRN
jgi:hypothetical protein